jgi:flagellin
MELTNYSFLQSRSDYLQSSAEMKVSSDRLSSGNRLVSGKKDVGAIGVNANLRSSRIQDRAERINLQNFHSFLQAQSDALVRVRKIYDRMGVLASRVLDPTINESDNQQFNKEFSELSDNLDKLVRKKVNGTLLFGGKSADFTEGLTDTNATGATPLRDSQDVLTTSGKISISLSPGGAADQIWVFQGKLPSELDEYFDSTTYLNNGNTFDPTDVARLSELNSKLYSHFETHGIFTTGPWQTSGNANANNFDTFEIEFDSCDVKVTPRFDDDNNASFGKTLYDNLVASGDLKTNIPPGDSTFITMIGVNAGNTAIYNVKASFTPTLPYNDILVPSSGQIFPAISFGNLGCSNISTEENASKVLAALDAELSNITDSSASIAAAQSRYQNKIESLGQSEVNSEISISRISDTDFAKETINFTKSKLNSEMAAQMMNKASRLKDLLIPLTTDHFRSRMLSSRI